MRIILDANLARSIGVWLSAQNHEVKDIRDVLPGASDSQINQLIQKESLILLTKDLDFGNLKLYPLTPNCGVILLRVFLLTTSEIIEMIRDIFLKIPEKDFFGNLVVARKGRYRIHGM